MAKRITPEEAAARVKSGDWIDYGAGAVQPVTFDIASMVKDLHAMVDEGKSLGYAMPMTSQALACFEALARAGLGGKDSVAVPVSYARKLDPAA